MNHIPRKYWLYCLAAILFAVQTGFSQEMGTPRIIVEGSEGRPLIGPPPKPFSIPATLDEKDIRGRIFRSGNADEKRMLYQRLGQIFEEKQLFAEAAEAYRSWLPSNPDYYSLIHVADVFKWAKKYKIAAAYYLKAAEISTAPHFAVSWATDCMLLAGNQAKTEELMTHLRKIHPGPDLEWFQARLLRLKGEKELAERTLKNLGDFYVKQARRGNDRRVNLLNAAKAYLDANEPEKGLSILDRLQGSSDLPALDIDVMRGEYFFTKKEYPRAREVYVRHPESLPMQISYGWALYLEGKMKEAYSHFQALHERYPDKETVKEGWRAVSYFRPWNLFYIFTRMDYGDYQSERDLHTAMAKYQWGRVEGALSYTNTGTYVRINDFDFREDLFGARFYRKATEDSAIQVHGLYFQNNDSLTNDGGVIGGKYYNFENKKFHWDSELNWSRYPDLNSVHSAMGLTFLLDPSWSAGMKLEGGYLGGDQSAFAETQTPIGFQLSLAFHDRNALVKLEGHAGERILMVDSEGLYAWNSLDTYREGASLMILQKGPGMEFYLKVGGTHVTSQVLRVRNEFSAAQVSSDYHVKMGSIGFNFRFH